MLLYILLNVSSSIPLVQRVAIDTYFKGKINDYTNSNNTKDTADIINADGTLKFSAILSFKNSSDKNIANMPAADIAVSERCMNKSEQKQSVVIGVPTVSSVDIALHVLYFPTAFISISPYMFINGRYRICRNIRNYLFHHLANSFCKFSIFSLQLVTKCIKFRL